MTTVSSSNVWAGGWNNPTSGDNQRTLIEQYRPQTPLIFIPGIFGSKLAVTGSTAIDPIARQTLNLLTGNCESGSDHWTYNQGDLVWINESTSILNKADILVKYSNSCSNYLDALQFNSSGNPIYSQVTKNEAIADDPYNNITIPYLESRGYILGSNLFLHPYDWRNDIDADMTSLDTLVSNILSAQGVSQVDLLTHSMGGLVARDYISNSTRAAKVHTLVELGDPHVGAPKLIAQLLYPACPIRAFSDLICVPNGQEANKLVQNFPGGFELMPSRKYYDLYPDLFPYVDTLSYDGMHGQLSFNNFRTLLASSGQKFNKNMTLFDLADNFHGSSSAGLDHSYSISNGVNIYMIVGSGQPTWGQIFDQFSLLGEIKPYAYTINGDDTVPVLSASLGLTSNVYYTNQKHEKLVTGVGIQKAVNLLASDSTSITGVQTTPFQFSGTIVSVHSPTLLDTYDDQGNHTGSSSAGFIEENIPGSIYDELGTGKYIYLPSGGTYHFSTRPLAVGSFDLDITTYDDSVATKNQIYQNVQQGANTTSSMTLSTTSATLSVDVNGDGSNIQSVSPTYTLTGSDTADIAAPFTSISLSPSPDSSGNYSDPVTATLTASATAGFSISHTYYTVDGGSQQTYSSPFNVTGNGSHTILYWSVDNVGLVEAQNSKTFTIVQSNQAPVVSLPSSVTVNQGVVYTASRSFTDSDSSSWSATVNYGDGGGTQSLTLSGNNFSLSHTYSSTGTYTLTVAVTDNQGAVGTASSTVTVSATTTVSFDDHADGSLTGSYSGISWGSSGWDIDSTIPTDSTKSVTFDGALSTGQSFSFSSPSILLSAVLYSNDSVTAMITLSCSGNNPVSKTVATNTHTTFVTNWTTACSTVSVTSSNGWNTNLDNLVYSSFQNPGVTPYPTPTPPPGVTLGYTSQGTILDTGDSGFMNGSKFTTGSTSGTTSSMSVFVGNVDSGTHNQYQMAIYTNSSGHPGTRVANTSSGTLNPLSWNTLSISATLSANTIYWLMYNTNSSTTPVYLNNMYYDTGASNTGAYAARTFGTWPTTFPTATLGNWKFSIYVSYQ